jgi:hypothetical protein
MRNNQIELADVVRRFKDPYLARFGHLMMPSQKKALADIAACMTAQMGGHQYQCRDCGQPFWVYHGCRNRACHGRQIRDWLEARQAELLPCDYYHIVATVPEETRRLFLSNQKFMYALFMRTVAGAVGDLCRDRKYLGATPGILMVLHTWTRQMLYHPHVHLLVTGGGVSDDGQAWSEPPGTFLPRKTWKQPWCSFSKHYGRSRTAVVDYLARYAFRIAITNARILDMDDTHVTFQYKQRDTGQPLTDLRGSVKGQWHTCRLTGIEFLRRFLMHVLPMGFHKLRYYGLWHPSKRDLQQRARLLLTVLNRDRPGQSVLIADLVEEAAPSGDGASHEGFSPSCPYCGSRQVDHLQERRRGLGP